MRKSAVLSSLVILFIAMATGFALAQSTTTKTLQGKVLTDNDVPLSGAIVYLQESKDNSIRSFISTSDGSYRFGQLATDSDYQVWAQYKNAKSATKTISSYNSRQQVYIDLHIKLKK
jgi:hypothetical protein